jgi:hypothetical protein
MPPVAGDVSFVPTIFGARLAPAALSQQALIPV